MTEYLVFWVNCTFNVSCPLFKKKLHNELITNTCNNILGFLLSTTQDVNTVLKHFQLHFSFLHIIQS